MYQIDEETYLLFVDFLVLCDAEVFHHLMVLAFDVHPPAIGDISDDEKMILEVINKPIDYIDKKSIDILLNNV